MFAPPPPPRIASSVNFLYFIVFVLILIQPYSIYAQSRSFPPEPEPWRVDTTKLRCPSEQQAFKKMTELIRLEREVRPPNSTFGLGLTSPNPSDRFRSKDIPPLMTDNGRIRIIDFEDGNKIKLISPTDPRYRQARRRLRKVEAIIGTDFRNYLNKYERGWKPLKKRRILAVAWNAIKNSKWGRKLTVTGVMLYGILKSRAVEASEVTNVVLDMLTMHLQGDEVVNSDPSLSDYLDILKKSAEFISPTNPDFSVVRSHLKSELDEAYNAISNDSSLGQQEKTKLLAKVREIQIALPPPNLSPPRNSPRQRSKRSRGVK